MTDESVVNATVNAALLQESGVSTTSGEFRSAKPQVTLNRVHQGFSPDTVSLPGVENTKAQFLELAESSIAARLKAFDREGFTHVIVIPLALPVGSIPSNDLPTVNTAAEDSSLAKRPKAERHDRYVPKATVAVTGLLNFSE